MILPEMMNLYVIASDLGTIKMILGVSFVSVGIRAMLDLSTEL